jgi:hypothetical protein
VWIRVLTLAILATATLTACTTQGTFVIPEGTQLEVYRRPVTPGPDGLVVTRPFPWTAAGMPPGGGIEYRLLQGNEVVQQGRLRARFRVVSIFWPVRRAWAATGSEAFPSRARSIPPAHPPNIPAAGQSP